MTPNDDTSPRKPRRLYKWLAWGLACIVVLLALAGAGVYYIPDIASSDWAKYRIEKQARNMLNRSVRLGRLRWSWSEGISLEDVEIADDPSFSQRPALTLERARLTIGWAALRHRRAVFDLEAEGLHVHLIRRADGKSNWETLLSGGRPSKAPRETPQGADWRQLALALPVDVRGHVRLRKMSLDVLDLAGNHRLSVRNATLDLDIPSLGHDPVTLAMAMEGEVDGRAVPPPRLGVRIARLAGADGRLRPANASIQVSAEFPGLRLSATGSLADMGLGAQADLDLPALLEALRPFAPPGLPHVSGTVHLVVALSGDPEETIRFDLSADGKGVVVSGGPLAGKKAGPLRFKTSHQGRLQVRDGILNMERGEIRVQDNSALSWHGTVKGLLSGALAAELDVTALSLDARELLVPAGEFVPRNVSFPPASPPSQPFHLGVERIRVNAALPAGPHRVLLQGMTLSIPAFRMTSGAGSVSAESVEARADRGDITITDQFPSWAAMTMAMKTGLIRVEGKEPLRLEGLEIPLLTLVAEDMKKSSTAMFGMLGTIRLEESATVGSLDLPGRARMEGLRQSLKGRWVLGPDPPLRADMDAFALSCPSLTMNSMPGRPLKTGLDLRAGLGGLRLFGLSPMRLDLEGARLDLDVGGLVKARLNASARDLGNASLDSEGRVELNMTGLAPLLGPYLPPGAAVRGRAAAEWSFSGRLPGTEEIETLRSNPREVSRIVQKTQFIKELQMSFDLGGLDVDLPAGGGGALEARGIRTRTPFKIVLKDGLGRLSFQGAIDVAGVERLPNLGKLPSPVAVSLSLSGEQQQLKWVRFSETLAAGAPYRAEQTLTLVLDGIDRTLEAGVPPAVSTLLERMNGELGASLKAAPGPGLSGLTGSVNVTGSVEAGARFALRGGKSLDAALWLDSPGLDLSRNDDVRLDHLKSRLRLEKQYGIAAFGPLGTAAGQDNTRLSRKVLEDRGPERSGERGGDAASRRLRDDLRGKLSGDRSIDADRIALRAAGLALQVRNPEIEFRLDRGLPAADHFQMDLLGGTVQGNLSVLREGDAYQVSTGCAFSGLRADDLVPGLKGELTPEEAELSGSLSVTVPLSEDTQSVLEGLRLRLNLSHIGSKALERFLYALDPHESNETVVHQRELLKIGTPRWVDVEIRYGTLSLSGELEAKGVRIDLPPIRRLNIGSLALEGQLERHLLRLGPVLEGLRILSADTIELGPDGKVRLHRMDSYP